MEWNENAMALIKDKNTEPIFLNIKGQRRFFQQK